MKKVKALVLLSGGLDSILAVKTLQNQGIRVTALSFKSYFFDTKPAEKAAQNLRVPLKVVDFSQDHLAMLKNPKHGYGKSMNPCIDCHTLMLKKAGEIMKKEKFDLVATGEVLGERPMSQNIRSLELIEKESLLRGYLLRPLSAKLLEPTVPEQKGFIARPKLFNIAGRSRKKQIVLAKKWGIKQYPAPAGGCLLTDMGFGERLKELLKICPKCGGNDVTLLKYGRHFILGKTKIVVGRNEKENKEIKNLSARGDILIEMKDYPGPLTLVRNYLKQSVPPTAVKKAQDLTKYYSTKTRGLTNKIIFVKLKST